MHGDRWQSKAAKERIAREKESKMTKKQAVPNMTDLAFSGMAIMASTRPVMEIDPLDELIEGLGGSEDFDMKSLKRKLAQHKRKQAQADELKKWAGVANAISNALTKEQKTAIGDGSFRIWFENGKPKTWRVFKSRNGTGGENTVWLHVPDKKHHMEFASGEALCKHLGLATNGNSAPRVLAKNNIPFVKTRPQGKVVLA